MKRSCTNQSGDTIIEVLLALSVIGMVLGAAFGIANRSVRLGQDAQERTEALKIAESQLEIFKSEYPSNEKVRSKTEDTPFCMSNNEAVLASEADCKNINGSGSEGFYSISIVPPALIATNKAYEIKVTWPRSGSVSVDGNTVDIENNLSLYYKLGSL